MLFVRFSGWFQCRLASDPDPTDEPRGVSGCSFALVGEDDLDRVIRLQPSAKTIERTFGPPIGVNVVSVVQDGRPDNKHILRDGRVELVGGAKFIEQNGAVVRRNTALIEPFELKITDRNNSDKVLLQRRALWAEKDGTATQEQDYLKLAPEILAQRQPRLQLNSLEVREASGIYDVKAFVDSRLNKLTELERTLEKKTDGKSGDDAVATELAGVRQRIEALRLEDWRGMRLHLLLAARASYRFVLNSQNPLVDSSLGFESHSKAPRPPWDIEFWMGAWDNDALCGYMEGRLVINQKE